MQDYEKLGAFYLGRLYDLAQRKREEPLLLYDSRDLVTHAVCVGMTGSGKTGLCVGLIEEAAIDGIPAIVIDPKGDLGNLLLTFPELRPSDFAPWINSEDARLKGMTDEQFAAQQAETWRSGLADWGQDGARIQRMRNAAEFAIYTPRSNTGLPVSIVSSFSAPPPEVAEDREVLRDRVSATATSILGLLGIDADPLRSREHILLATILDCAWRQGRDLDLTSLIGEIQKPPVSKLGALDLESFYPAKERFELAMSLNNLLASPGFEAWMEGEPLDISRILYTKAGKPRVAIFSIAHLDDNERMFFVSLLLNQVVSWMRSQSGTTSLRALLYMDEIYGYFPPVANPPSKGPLMLLLKQGRAFGLGVVLATQNPVDLDYKGLANAGTWFIGRLQTERDKARVLDGLEGAAAGSGKGFDRATVDRMLSSLGSRVFLLNNVHDDAPAVFQTRWTLSYLRGPLTRQQLKQLMNGAAIEKPAVTAPAQAAESSVRPVLPPQVPQYFVPLRAATGSGIVYRPMLLGAAEARFTDLKLGVDVARNSVRLTEISDGAVAVNWADSKAIDVTLEELTSDPPAEGSFDEPPRAASNAKNYTVWSRDLANWVLQNERVGVFRSPGSKLVSAPGESERDFRIRLQQASREQRDDAVEALRRKYAPKTAVLQERLRRARAVQERERQQAQDQKLSAALSFGSTLLGAFLGRKALSTGTIGRAGTAARAASRARRESLDVERAGDTIEAIEQQLADLQGEFDGEAAALQTKLDPSLEELEAVEVRAKKTNIAVRLVALVWVPYAGGNPVY
ncbi:MAG TPA: DUF87 domain-containing protein [Bryobacteraceae bacterium]|nr:DUF87 domain-containing protein [Bryobacteraceae bacterium]